uniref:Long-chain-fatty-acid--CoA ligase n=1 Tax=Anguilla anguilla TaxID=7936 RepID=A0A0E9XDH2_ANGAN
MLKSPALYIYTSGTTGLPKAAVITHERVWLASFLLGLVGVSSDDVLYVCLPLYHTSAFLMGLTGAIDRGNHAQIHIQFEKKNLLSKTGLAIPCPNSPFVEVT